MPGIHADTSGDDALVTFHSLHLTWSQWTSVLTENIITKNLKVHIILYNFSSSWNVSRKINKYFRRFILSTNLMKKVGTKISKFLTKYLASHWPLLQLSLWGDLKFPVNRSNTEYIHDIHIHISQATSLFDHLKTGKTLRELELDGHVNISAVTDTVFTNVINTLSSVKFIGTVISNKQFTGLLTKVLNEGRTQLMPTINTHIYINKIIPRCRDKHKAAPPGVCEPPQGASQHPRARPRTVPQPQYLRLGDGGAAEGDPVLLDPRHQVGGHLTMDNHSLMVTSCAPGRCWLWVWRDVTWGRSTL